MLPKQQYHKNYLFGTARLSKLGIFLARSTTDPKPEAINPKSKPFQTQSPIASKLVSIGIFPINRTQRD